MDGIVSHNPDYGTSRNTLALICRWGIAPDITAQVASAKSALSFHA
jgi:hypothetical protein